MQDFVPEPPPVSKSTAPGQREEEEPPYDPAAAHPEIYENARFRLSASCAVQTIGAGADAARVSTITFNLGSYTREVSLAVSLWDGFRFSSLPSQGLPSPEFVRHAQTAAVEITTDPAQTRFRLDTQYGGNLVLGYADCSTDDPPALNPAPNPLAAYRETYRNERYGMRASCHAIEELEGAAMDTALVIFELGSYAGPVFLDLGTWDWDDAGFHPLPGLGYAAPELQRDGQRAWVEVATDPARTRFRLATQYGGNLLVGYADCRVDDPPETYRPYAGHLEMYQNERFAMSAACQTIDDSEVGWEGGRAVINLDLGRYTRPVRLTLGMWDGTAFRTLDELGVDAPELQRDGQTATVQIATNPAQTRFRLDSQWGRNLLLGYANCPAAAPSE